jgi:P pilus assembly chaperone PapD
LECYKKKGIGMRLLKFIFLCTLIFAFVIIIDIKAFAAFVVTPMEFHLNTASSETTTGSFWVRNRGEETIALKVYVGDFWIEPDGKEAFLEPGTIERSCSKWIEVSPEELELTPNESKLIRFNLSVPPGKTGTFWAMIFVEQTNKPTIKTAQQGQQQFNILSFQRVGVRIFEETPDAVKGEGKISQVNVVRGGKDEFIRVDLKIENNGEALLRCKGNVEIKNERGDRVENVQLDEFNCYPKASRIIPASFKTKLNPGQYTALAIIDYGAEYLVAGEAVFKVNALTGSVEIAKPSQVIASVADAVRTAPSTDKDIKVPEQVSNKNLAKEEEKKEKREEKQEEAKEKSSSENKFIKSIRGFFEPVWKKISQAFTGLFKPKK